MATTVPDPRVTFVHKCMEDAPPGLTDAEREARRILSSMAESAGLDHKSHAVWKKICWRHYFLYDGEPWNKSSFLAPDKFETLYGSVTVFNRRMTDRSVQKTIRHLMDVGLVAGEASKRIADGRGYFTQWDVRPALYDSLRNQIVEDHWRRTLFAMREENMTPHDPHWYSRHRETTDSLLLDIFQAMDSYEDTKQKLSLWLSDQKMMESDPSGWMWVRSVQQVSDAMHQRAETLSRALREYESTVGQEVSRQRMTRYLASIIPGQPFDTRGPNDE